MTPERWARIKEIFACVIDIAPQERTAALMQACQGDAELEAEVQRLLAQSDAMGRFLEGSPPDSACLLAPGSLLANRYQIVSLVGSGGMGEVYEAEDKELGGQVALKVVHGQMNDEAALERFRREVQLARQVTHPNVCRVFDIGHHLQQSRELVFLTMEFVPGETLSARLRRKGTIARPEALAIARQLCQALVAAHQAGVLHRDFKPGNVMLTGSGEEVRAIVTDFGMARWMGRAKGTVGTLTTQGQIFGTPAYMSPEQLQGKELTAASDIYSLGLVLHEMVTGIRPFHDDSSMGEAVKRLTEDPPEPRKMVPGLDRNWNRTVMRCLQRDPAKRYATVQDVSSALLGEEKHGLSLIWKNRRRLAAALIPLLATVSTLVYWILYPPLPAEKHIAVLPFRCPGGNAANQATADSLAESLTENLTRLQAPGSSFWVVPWRAVRDRPPNDERHAGAALGANLLLTGAMDRHEGRLRLTSELKDASSMRVLRSSVIDIPEAEAVTLEDKLVEQTASTLRLDLPAGSLQRLRVRDTPAPGAYEFYEEGRGYLLRLNGEDVDQAIHFLNLAIEKDPKFAPAKASLAFAYEWKYRTTRELRWLERSRDLCAQALALNDRLSRSHLAYALILQDSGDRNGGIRELQQALALDPASDDARNILSRAYDQAGRPFEAETLLKETLSRNPANWTNYNDLAAFYYRHQQYNLAEPLFRSATELAPRNPMAFYNLGGLYAVQGKNKEAEDILRRAIAIKPTAAAYSNLGTVLFNEKQYADSAAMLEKAVELAPADRRYWSNLGNAYAAAGNRTKADQAFRSAVQAAQNELVLRPRDSGLLQDLAIYYAKLHEKRQALLALAKVTGPESRTPDVLSTFAEVYEITGDRQQALSLLGAAVRAGLPLQSIQNEPALDQLRADPRYASIAGHQGPVKGP